jgi:ligand-binding sensor domain-containing protein
MIATVIYFSRRSFQLAVLLLIPILASSCKPAGGPIAATFTAPISTEASHLTSKGTITPSQIPTKTVVPSRTRANATKFPTRTPISTNPFVPQKVPSTLWTRYDPREIPGLANGSFLVIEIAPNGDIWAGAVNAISRFNGSEWVSYPILDDSPDITGVHVRAIAVTPNDVVWVSSYSGQEGISEALYRFDGQTWVKERDNVHVTAIEVGPDGALWFAVSPIKSRADSPGGVWRFDGTHWTSYTQADGLISDAVNDLAFDQSGTLWLATDGGISAFDGQNWNNYSMQQFCPEWGCGLGDRGITATEVEVSPDGTIWFLAQYQALYQFRSGVWAAYENDTLFKSGLPIGGLCVSNNGNVWVVEWGTLAYFDGENWFLYDKSSFVGHATDVQCAPDGAIWIGGLMAISKLLPPH